jgi:hypothetical protein
VAFVSKDKYTHSMTEAFSDGYFSERLATANQRQLMYLADIAWLQKHMKNSENLSILDIGCSDGFFTSLLSSIGRPYGVEINPVQRSAAQLNHGLTVFESLQEVVESELEFDCLLLRGTLHHLSKTELDFIINLNPRFIIFLQSINTESIAIRFIGPDAFKVIYPDRITSDRVYLDNLSYIKKAMDQNSYFRKANNFPYFSTPYKKPFRDLIAFIRGCFFVKPLPSSFTNALPGVIFRAIYSR